MSTVYQKADAAMRVEITRYLALAQATAGFTAVREEHLQDAADRTMFASGVGLHLRVPQQNLWVALGVGRSPSP